MHHEEPRLMKRLIVRNNRLAVSVLAEALKLSRSNVLKDLKKRAISTEKQRDPAAGGQFVSVLLRENAQLYVDLRKVETLGSGEAALIELIEA